MIRTSQLGLGVGLGLGLGLGLGVRVRVGVRVITDLYLPDSIPKFVQT